MVSGRGLLAKVSAPKVLCDLLPFWILSDFLGGFEWPGLKALVLAMVSLGKSRTPGWDRHHILA